MKVTKKLLLVVSFAFVMVLLAACSKTYTVKFDSQGGTAVAAVDVKEGEMVAEPAAPTKASDDVNVAWSFVGWYENADGSGSSYDFSAPVEGDLTLYAVWSDNIVVRFNTKVAGLTVDPVYVDGDGGTIAEAPAAPERAGYRFGGWFEGKAGLTWLEPQAVSFPLEISASTEFYAYWEPLNSKAATYTDGETYFTSLDSSSSIILNPLVYQWSHEDAFIDLMSTPLYSTEVDWDLAIEEGVADAPGDFSKIYSAGNPDGTYSIEALDYHYVLVGATQYPTDANGDEHLTADGQYDRAAATTYTDTVWTFHLRDDLQFEDGTPITAATYEYTLKQFLDGTQNNYRANIFYYTEDNKNGYPIVNSYEYFTGTATWDQVGFEVVDDYTFTVTFSFAKSQATAVAFGNDLRLVEPTAYAASLNNDGNESTYGTPESPYVSYGAYILKTWDENQKLVFNKNYEYVAKDTVNYKSYVYQIVDTEDAREALFAEGSLSALGLTNDFYAKYAESDNLYKSWDGYPQYLIINTADADVEGAAARPEILFDVRFRQALLYGFDRGYYATNVYAPNTASLLPVPLDTKSYIQDALYYSQSPAHLAVLEGLGIDPSSNGYIPTKAVELFNAAYADWVTAGNTGKVTIELLTNSDDFAVSLAEYVESSYEALFGADKLDIVLDKKDTTGVRADLGNWDFDISLNSIGFGSSTGVWWQYPAISFMGDIIGGGSLGLSQPYDASQEDGYGLYLNAEITVDLTNTYNYLDALGEDYMTENELEGHLLLWGYLQASVDEVTGETKPAGIYQGSVYDLGILTVAYDTPWDGSAAEPFSGATVDTWAFVAAFEEVFFEYVPLIPTVTRSSATVYAANVVIEWPAYSTAFGWGSNRYRYLNTDPDFAE